MATVRRVRRRRERRRVERPLRDRGNPLEELSEEGIFLRYRFRSDSILYITSVLTDQLSRNTKRSNPLPPLLQVLVTLRFLATGGFFSLISDASHVTNISATSVFRCVRDVTTAMCQHAKRYIHMPTGDEISKIKERFYSIAGFPNVLGCVDGTFIKILCPKNHEADYLNRKGFHSLNVQMICDASYRIINCVAKWPGSVHDSRVFRDSAISVAFETGRYKGFLLGDSAYPCTTYLMTPYLTPITPSQEKFNKAQTRTRVLIEQTFGILKRRFSCLHTGLRTSPIKGCKITTACAILHNIGIDRGDIISVEEIDIEGTTTDLELANHNTGFNVRDHICESFFS